MQQNNAGISPYNRLYGRCVHRIKGVIGSCVVLPFGDLLGRGSRKAIEVIPVLLRIIVKLVDFIDDTAFGRTERGGQNQERIIRIGKYRLGNIIFAVINHKILNTVHRRRGSIYALDKMPSRIRRKFVYGKLGGLFYIRTQLIRTEIEYRLEIISIQRHSYGKKHDKIYRQRLNFFMIHSPETMIAAKKENRQQQ